jgi:uncharacterized membrane protein YgcG
MSICLLQLTKQIVSVTNGMDSILGSMDVEKIANVMDKFESQFDTLDVRAGHMERSIASSTSTSVPEDDVDDLMARVRQQRDLKDKGSMVAAGTGSLAAPASAAAAGPGKVAEAAAAAPSMPPMPPAAPTNKPDDKGGAGGGGEGGAGVDSGSSSGGGGGADSLAARLAALRR